MPFVITLYIPILIRFMAKKVVILGAGFAGLQVARRLKSSDYEILLIDQYNFHQFQPLFYQVATGRLEPSAISFPLRKVFQKEKHVHVRITKTNEVDFARQVVRTNEGEFSYDYLIIATGCTSNYFGNRNFERYAFPMKSTNEAITLRNRISSKRSTKNTSRRAPISLKQIRSHPLLLPSLTLICRTM